MAIVPGKWKMFDLSKLNMGKAIINFSTATFKATLHTSLSNVNTLSGKQAYADIDHELATANGYTNGGLTLSSVTWTNTTGTSTFTSALMQWLAAGGSITARFVAVRISGTVGGVVDPLVAVMVLDTTAGGTDVTATDGNTFTITPDPAGILFFNGANTD